MRFTGLRFLLEVSLFMYDITGYYKNKIMKKEEKSEKIFNSNRYFKRRRSRKNFIWFLRNFNLSKYKINLF